MTKSLSLGLLRLLRSQRGMSTAASGEPKFHFKCTQCGKCCTGRGGRVRVNEREVEELAATLNTPIPEVHRRFLTPTDAAGQWLIKQTDDDTRCTFLVGKKCSVYEARPTQCRTFPWWPQNLISEYDWQLAARGCEGIDLGHQISTTPAVTIDDILPEAITYDIHQSGENYTYEEIKEMLTNLQDLEPDFLDDYKQELQQKFHRTIVHQDGEVMVFDTFLHSMAPTRSFVFNDRPQLVQTEMVLEPTTKRVDPSKLVLDVHRAMVLSFLWLNPKDPNKRLRVALLGSGGGSMARFLLHSYPQIARLDAVEPNKTVNRVAREFFGLGTESQEQFQLYEEFGEGFVAKADTNEKPQYDVVMIDVEGGCSNDGISAPPRSMLTVDFLQSVKQLMRTDGVAVVNVITQDEGALGKATQCFGEVFDQDATYWLPLANNTIFYLFQSGHSHNTFELKGLARKALREEANVWSVDNLTCVADLK